jgi:hypothetical protein
LKIIVSVFIGYIANEKGYIEKVWWYKEECK